MGRVVQAVFILFLTLNVCAETVVTYKGLPLGGYVDDASIKKIDLKNTLSQGYVCYLSKGKLVKMLFDTSASKPRFTAVSLFIDGESKPGLVCMDNDEIEPLFVGDAGFSDKNMVYQRLQESGFSPLSTRISNHYLFSQLVDSGKKCFDVSDEYEGNYSFFADFSKKMKIVVEYYGDSVLSITKSIVVNKTALKTFASPGCAESAN